MRQQTVLTSRGERNRGVARRFHARGWVPVQFAASGFRRVARRSPPEAGFSQRGRAYVHRPRLTSPNQTCLCRGAVSSWRSAGRRRHPSPTRRLPYSIEGPARAPASSKDEELAHGLADEPTWRLPASGWDFPLNARSRTADSLVSRRKKIERWQQSAGQTCHHPSELKPGRSTPLPTE